MTSGAFLGNFALNDTFGGYVGMSYNDSGTASITGPTGVETFYMDVYDTVTGTKVESDAAMTAVAAGIGIYRLTSAVVLSTANGYAEGKAYFVVVKDSTGDNTVTYMRTFHFMIDKQDTIEGDTQYITRATYSDNDAENTAADNSLVNRIYTLERNQLDVIFKRLKRALGLLGENQIIDGYFYDDSGNVTQCRVRLFDSVANRDAALSATWDDTENESDPAPASVDTAGGEIGRYTILASHLLPRNLRTAYQGKMSADAADQANDDSSVI